MEIIVGKDAGFCAGVKRSVNGTEKLLYGGIGRVIYCLGELVHNKTVIDILRADGLHIVESIDEVPDGSLCIIRAHGIPKEDYEKARKKELELHDLTCPNVLKIHMLAEKLVKEKFFIILVGKADHPEIIGTKSYCGDNSVVIQSKEEMEQLLNDDNFKTQKRVAMISQTTYSLALFEELEQMLKDNVSSDVCLSVNNTICNATMNRQKEAEGMSKIVDKMIIIGGKNSSNTRKLYELSKQYCEDTEFVEGWQELDYNNYATCNKVGIMAGASTPQSVIKVVVQELRKRR